MTITEACEWPITCGHSVCATGQRLGMAGVRHVQGRCLTHVSTKPFESFTRSASSALIAARAAASAAAFTAAFAFAFSSSTSAALMARPWVRGVMGMPYALSAMMAIVRRPQDPQRKKAEPMPFLFQLLLPILGNLMKGKIKIFGSLVCLIARARRTRHPRSRASWVCPLCALAPLPPSRPRSPLNRADQRSSSSQRGRPQKLYTLGQGVQPWAVQVRIDLERCCTAQDRKESTVQRSGAEDDKSASPLLHLCFTFACFTSCFTSCSSASLPHLIGKMHARVPSCTRAKT